VEHLNSLRVLYISVPNVVCMCFDLVFFFSEKEQTPLQEALNQLIRQLQRYGVYCEHLGFKIKDMLVF